MADVNYDNIVYSYGPCMCGADDCRRCYPGRFVNEYQDEPEDEEPYNFDNEDIQ